MKTLLTFVGTGRLKEGTGSSREYDTTKYSLDEHNGEYSFVSSFLQDKLKFDRLIIVGTMKSMWEEVYRKFAGENIDENVWLELAKAEEYDANTPINYDFVKPIESVLPKGSKIVLFQYGLTDKEILHNLKAIIDVEKIFKKEDRLSVDITHSFRSMPVYSLIFLRYLKEASNKYLKIESIYYGMFEAKDSTGATPIVRLDILNDLQYWIQIASELKKHAHFKTLAEQLASATVGEKALAAQFIELHNSIQLNAGENIAKLVNKILEKLTKLDLISQPSMQIILPEIINALESLKREKDELSSHYYFKLAKFHLANGREGFAALNAWEGIIEAIAEVKNIEGDFQQKDKRISYNITSHLNIANKKLKRDEPFFKQILSIHKLRRKVAHGWGGNFEDGLIQLATLTAFLSNKNLNDDFAEFAERVDLRLT